MKACCDLFYIWYIDFLTDIRYMKIGENEMERIKTKDRILLAVLDLFSEKGYDRLDSQ